MTESGPPEVRVATPLYPTRPGQAPDLDGTRLINAAALGAFLDETARLRRQADAALDDGQAGTEGCPPPELWPETERYQSVDDPRPPLPRRVPRFSGDLGQLALGASDAADRPDPYEDVAVFVTYPHRQALP